MVSAEIAVSFVRFCSVMAGVEVYALAAFMPNFIEPNHGQGSRLVQLPNGLNI